jgi:hypothetical protein
MHNDQTQLTGQFGVKARLKPAGAEQFIQFDQRLANESHPAVLGGQVLQDFGVEDKNAMHFGAVFEGVKQRGVVCHP